MRGRVSCGQEIAAGSEGVSEGSNARFKDIKGKEWATDGWEHRVGYPYACNVEKHRWNSPSSNDGMSAQTEESWITTTLGLGFCPGPRVSVILSTHSSLNSVVAWGCMQKCFFVLHTWGYTILWVEATATNAQNLKRPENCSGRSQQAENTLRIGRWEDWKTAMSSRSDSGLT